MSSKIILLWAVLLAALIGIAVMMPMDTACEWRGR